MIYSTGRLASLILVIGLVILLLIIARKLLRLKIKERLYQPVKKQKNLKNIDYYDLFIGVKSGRVSPRSLTAGWCDRFPLPGAVTLGAIRDEKNEETEDYVNVWYINNFKGNKVVLYFHGNSYNVSYRKYMIDICKILKLNLLLVDYRGYGRSSGEPKPVNILEDAEVSYKFLIKEGYKPHDIIVWGESLGGSPACYTTGKYPVYCLILLSTFSSLHSLLRDNNNMIREGALFVLRAITIDMNRNTNNVAFLKSVDKECPVVIFHSREDTMIPYSNAIELISALPANHEKLLIEIKGNHDGPKISSANFRSLLNVLKLNELTNKEVDKIIKIIDSLSFVSQSNSSYDAAEKIY